MTLLSECSRKEQRAREIAGSGRCIDRATLVFLGDLDLRIPQVRNGDFYPAALERGTRSERALKLALAEM